MVKEILDFLSRLSEKDPFTVMLIIIFMFILAVVVGGVVAYTFLQRERKRDEVQARADTDMDKKDSAMISLANTLALQGARALDQNSTLNELMKRQTISMEKQGDSMLNQGKDLHGISLVLNDMSHADKEVSTKLDTIHDMSKEDNDGIANTQVILMRQERAMSDLKARSIQDMTAIQAEIKDKFAEIKKSLDKLEEMLTSSVEKASTQAHTIEDMKTQLDGMVTAVSLISDNTPKRTAELVVPADIKEN